MFIKIGSFRRNFYTLLGFSASMAVVYFACRWFQVEVLHNTLRVGPLDREFRLVIPVRTRNQKNLPVVIALHGTRHTTDEFAEETGLDALAARHGFLLVYLQGRNRVWPATKGPAKTENNTPDLEFFDAVCDTMITKYGADRSRVYVMGSSAGGAMCNFVVAMRSEPHRGGCVPLRLDAAAGSRLAENAP